MNAPLAGTRVVAWEQAVAMPFCSWMLAELGADVIKLERAGTGDVLRGWDEAVGGLSTGYVWLTGGKRDMAVNLGTAGGRDVVRRLACGADVFLENFAPGVAGRFGLDEQTLRADNPRLIYCSLSGYGQIGPYRDVKAYDLLIQGETGVLLSNGTVNEPAKVGLPITDLIGGSTAAIGILAAMHQRELTGAGAYLDVAMLESVLPWLGYFPQHYWHGGNEPPRTGMRHQYLSPYGPYLASDGQYVNLVVASAEHWRVFCLDVVDQPGWLVHEHFADIPARKAHRAEVEAAVESVIAQQPRKYWLDRLAAAKLPHGEVRSIESTLRHPQVLARDMIVEADSPVGRLRLVRFPLADPAQSRVVPSLGEHTDALLAEIGYTPSEIDALRGSGAVG